MKIISITILILISLFSMEGCYYDNESYLYPTVNICDTTNINYSQTVTSIIQTNCYSGCHNGATPTGGFTLETYNEVKIKATAGTLVGRMKGVGSIMPPAGALPFCTIDKIQAWVNAGAPNN